MGRRGRATDMRPLIAAALLFAGTHAAVAGQAQQAGAENGDRPTIPADPYDQPTSAGNFAASSARSGSANAFVCASQRTPAISVSSSPRGE